MLHSRTLSGVIAALAAVALFAPGSAAVAAQDVAPQRAAGSGSDAILALPGDVVLAATQDATPLLAFRVGAPERPSAGLHVAPSFQARALDLRDRVVCDGAVAPCASPLARWCLAHSTSTSLG